MLVCILFFYLLIVELNLCMSLSPYLNNLLRMVYYLLYICSVGGVEMLVFLLVR